MGVAKAPAGRLGPFLLEYIHEALWNLRCNLPSVCPVSGFFWAPIIDKMEPWAAAGLKGTLLRCEVKPEVVYGNEKAVQPRVQA